MTSYSEVFKEILDITHHDYAGWDEKQGWDDPEFHLKKIERLEGEQELTPQKFTEIVNDYLISFQDRHMYFLLEGSENVKKSTRGFRTRRYNDTLYVTETYEENRFPKGSKIISIDNQTIEQLFASKQYLLRETNAEREDWSNIFNQSSFIKIENENGQQPIEFDLKNYEPAPQKKEPLLKAINEKTLLMTLPSFADVEAILDFVQKHEEELKSCTNLIIDVRKNSGGNGQAVSSLLHYIFPYGERPSSAVKLREFNCTNRNSDLFIQLCSNARKNISDEGTLSVLDFAEEQFETYRGQGFVAFDFSNLLEEEVFEVEGTDLPRKVIVMSDSHCASAAEYFVETCMESSKVTVIGRSTMGVNDYSDLVIKGWDNMFSLYYPVSRIVQKTLNDPLHGKGIQPHHYIPWTPEHIQKDLDLLYALEMVQVELNTLEV
ncbi:S41 family peptidase [Filibacter tadaridae]|uniref:Peptidase family S41 n=1 Tax=Filibacter tadaridae TaxID=2483811 RepID=A0A3P5XAS5_9BACL|nr:S41 family peptidase [Filibacter tadaridae]VDC25529.1 Peptidase family S41 [Filibacter tadaridae]